MTSGTALQPDQLRAAFIRFFTDRGHSAVPSASLIPHDPSVLFTIAGMVPFKPFFLGDEVPPWKRATSVQKCFRTVDIDIVGTTHRHCTFFEMLGNFSFGDYFKADAIPYAWELVTGVLGIDGDRIWITVHESDDEAAQLWTDTVGVPPERVQRLGDDNFWKMGDTGPCGPSSELFFDKGDTYGADGGPAFGGAERFVEIWNLVFMQYNRAADGTTEPLPRPSIDTGAGLERILPVLHGVDSIFATDLFVADDRDGTVDHRPHLRRRGIGGCRASHPGRPRAGDVDAGIRWCAAGQRRPWLRAAPDHPTCGPAGPAAGCGRALCHSPGGHRGRRPGRGLSGTGRTALAHRRGGVPRRRRLSPYPGHRIHHPRGAVGLGSPLGLRGGGLPSCTTPTGFRSSSPWRSPRRPGSRSIWPPSKRPWNGNGNKPVPQPGRAGWWPTNRPTVRCWTTRARPCSWANAPTATRPPPGGGGAGQRGCRTMPARPRSSSTAPRSTPRVAGRSVTPAPS